MRLRSKLDRWIVGIAFVLLVISTSLLVDDSFLGFDSYDSGKLQQAGYVESSTNDLRRRFAKSLLWLSIDSNEKVFDGDMIFTGEGSKAVIALDDGSKLTLDANTLIVIRTKNGRTNLDLQYGSLQGDLKGGSLQITSNGQVTELSGEGSQVQISQTGTGTDVTVLKGNATLLAGGTSKLLSENQGANVAGDGKISARERDPIFLSKPKIGALVWQNPGEPVQFSWKKNPRSKTYKIEVSQNRNFNTVVAQSTTGGISTSFSTLPESGGFFWRVTGTGDKDSKQQSVSYSFSLLPNTPPQPVYPDNDAKLVISPGTDEKPRNTQVMLFQWKDQKPNEAYFIEIAEDENFSKILNRADTIPLYYRSPELKPGKYFWRVKGLHKERKDSPWSDTQVFSLLTKDQALMLAKTDLEKKGIADPSVQGRMLKANNSQYEIIDQYNDRTIASLSKKSGTIYLRAGRDAPEIKWTTTSEEGNYQIEISDSADFKSPVVTSRRPNPMYRWNQVSPGNYYWRAKRIDETGEVSSNPVAMGSMEVRVAPPVLRKIKPVEEVLPNTSHMNRPLQKVNFEWTRVSFANKYELQYSSKPDFKGATKINVPKTSQVIQVPAEGKYFWRVRALASTGDPVSRYSPPSTFEYERRLALKTPKTFLPPDQETLLFLANSEIYVMFNWRRVPNAKKYRLEVSKSPNFENIMFSKTTRSSSFLLQQKLPQGRLYWRLRAETGELTSKWTGVKNFVVKYQ